MEAQPFAVHIRLTASASRFPATVMFAEWRYLRSGLSSQDSASFPRGWVTAREAQPGGSFQQRRRSQHQSASAVARAPRGVPHRYEHRRESGAMAHVTIALRDTGLASRGSTTSRSGASR
jgi:hypothetical protein